MKRIICITWKEPYGHYRYENFFTDWFITDFVSELKKRGCTDIEIEEVEL